MRAGIVIYFLAALGYILVVYVGPGEVQIEPKTVWSWLMAA